MNLFSPELLNKKRLKLKCRVLIYSPYVFWMRHHFFFEFETLQMLVVATNRALKGVRPGIVLAKNHNVYIPCASIKVFPRRPKPKKPPYTPPEEFLPVKQFRREKTREWLKKLAPFESKHDFHPIEHLYCNDFEEKVGTRRKLWYHKRGSKRAKAMVKHLNFELEEEGDLKNSEKMDPFKPGDAVEVKFRLSVDAKKDIVLRGVVIGVRNRGFSSSFLVLGEHEGSSVEYNFSRYSPLISSVKLIQKSFIHDGKKPTRRAKLYYLRERPLNQIKVPKELLKNLD